MAKLTKFRNLLSANGMKYKALIKSVPVEGVITVENNKVYLCQNHMVGADCSEKQGYKYSWTVVKGTPDDLKDNDVSNFELTLPKGMKELAKSPTTEIAGYQVNITKEGDFQFGCGALVVKPVIVKKLLEGYDEVIAINKEIADVEEEYKRVIKALQDKKNTIFSTDVRGIAKIAKNNFDVDIYSLEKEDIADLLLHKNLDNA